MEIAWKDGHKSIYLLKWLKERSFHKEQQQTWLDSNFPKYRTWNADFIKKIPVLNFNEVVTNDKSLLRWLQHLEIVGICMLSDVPNKLGSVRILAEAVGFIRKTHYGLVFPFQLIFFISL